MDQNTGGIGKDEEVTKRKKHMIEPVAAQSPEIGRMLGMLEETRRSTLVALEGLTVDLLDRMPDCGVNTISTLLYHIAAIEADWLFEDVMQTGLSPLIAPLFDIDVRDEEGVLSRLRGSDLEAYLERLERVRAVLLDVYQKMSLEDFRAPHDLEEYTVTPEWALFHLMQHEAEHRSQIEHIREEFAHTDQNVV